MKKLIFVNLILLTPLNLLFSQTGGGVGGGGYYPDNFYPKENYMQRKVIAYHPIREADVLWAQRIWRTIDLREKINHPLYFPTTPIQNRKSYMQVVMQAVNEGSLTAFGNAAFDDEFQQPMTKAEIEKIGGAGTDTIEVQNPDPPYDYIKKVIKREFDISTVKQVQLKEDWFFDKQRSKLYVRIIGMCPIREVFDENGEYRGPEALFWFYFPEARSIFVNEEVYNVYNDSERRTLDDLFMNRRFSSFIHKRTNVYDRKISQYQKGIDELLEAQKLKENIFNFEHDLWSF